MHCLAEKVLNAPTVIFDGSGCESTLLIQILLEIGHELGKAPGAIFGKL
jgi:hypothetical protein